VLVKLGIDLADGRDENPGPFGRKFMIRTSRGTTVPDLPLGGAWSRPGISDTSRGWVKQTQVIRQLERENGAYPPAARHWNRVVVLQAWR
jgi:hypothetical protein